MSTESDDSLRERDVHFLNTDSARPAINFDGMIVVGLGETSIKSEYPELDAGWEDLSAVDPDDQA